MPPNDLTYIDLPFVPSLPRRGQRGLLGLRHEEMEGIKGEGVI